MSVRRRTRAGGRDLAIIAVEHDAGVVAVAEREAAGARDADGNLPPEVWAERDIAATLNLNDLGSETRAVELVVTPLAVRGRDGGAQIEVGATNERTPSGGSSQAMVAVTTLGDRTHALTAEGHDASEDGTGRGTPIIAATLTASTSRQGIGTPGRRQEDDHNLVAFQPQAGGDSALSIGATAPCLSVGQQAAIASHTEVRRLTPLECERLQGHPDNWTKVATRPDGTTYEQSDSQRYKQMGNGVAVPVFEWVARRLVAEHERLTQAGAA
jgi:DNA (cytosine-5)-methyltransferase 1